MAVVRQAQKRPDKQPWIAKLLSHVGQAGGDRDRQ
jgi:hypothetical protein